MAEEEGSIILVVEVVITDTMDTGMGIVIMVVIMVITGTIVVAVGRMFRRM